MTALKELKAAIADDEADEWTMEREEEEERKRRASKMRKERGKANEVVKQRSVTRVFETGYGYAREELSSCPRGGNGSESYGRPEVVVEEDAGEDDENDKDGEQEGGEINWRYF